MAGCLSTVPHNYLEPSTHIVHPCTDVCDVIDPVTSPVDCEEMCPDFYICLLNMTFSLNHDVLGRNSNGFKSSKSDDVTSRNRQPGSMHLVVIAVTTVALLVSIAFIVVICFIYEHDIKRKPHRRVDFPHPVLNHHETPSDEQRTHEQSEIHQAVLHCMSSPSTMGTQTSTSHLNLHSHEDDLQSRDILGPHLHSRSAASGPDIMMFSGNDHVGIQETSSIPEETRPKTQFTVV